MEVGRKTPVTIFNGGGGIVLSMVPHPDGQRFLNGSESGRITLWRIDGDQPVATMKPPPTRIVLSPDGERFLAIAKNKLELWQMGVDHPLVTAAAEGGASYSVLFDRDGKRFLVGNKDHKVRLWQTGDDKPLETLDVGAIPSAALFLPDGNRLLVAAPTAASPGRILLWRIGDEKPSATFEGDIDPAKRITLLPDGQRFLTGTEDGKVGLWTIGTEKPLAVFDSKGTAVYSMAVFPDGQRFLTASDDGKARLWRIGQDKPLAVFDSKSGALLSVVILPDGRQFLTSSAGGKIVLWRIGEERLVAELDAGEGVYDLVLHPDKQSFLAASNDGKASKWRIPEAALASAGQQVERACAALKESGVTEFSEEDYQRFPILDRTAPHPCAKVWRLATRANAG